jgi:hypothetical protein
VFIAVGSSNWATGVTLTFTASSRARFSVLGAPEVAGGLVGLGDEELPPSSLQAAPTSATAEVSATSTTKDEHRREKRIEAMTLSARASKQAAPTIQP